MGTKGAHATCLFAGGLAPAEDCKTLITNHNIHDFSKIKLCGHMQLASRPLAQFKYPLLNQALFPYLFPNKY